MTDEYNEYNDLTTAQSTSEDVAVDESAPNIDTNEIAGGKPVESVDETIVVKQSETKVPLKENDKQIPHNLEIEASVIGAILKNNQLLEKAITLEPKHFYAPENQIIYNWIKELEGRNQTASPKTLSHLADNEPAIAELGGTDYLAKLASDVFSVTNVGEFAEILEDLYIKRQVIELGENMIIDGYDNDIENTGKVQIEKTEQALFDLAEKGDARQQDSSLGEALSQTLKNAENAYLNPSGLVGVTTGFTELDRQMGGLHKSDLLILAGRPAMGKTALATNIAFNAAKAYTTETDENGNKVSNGGIVLFFSLEMSSDQLATRIISEQAEISSNKIRLGEINEEQFGRLAEK